MRTDWLRSKKFWIFLFVGILLAISGSFLPWQIWFSALKHWLATLGPWAMPAFILIYLLLTILGLPNIPLIILSGTLFGLVKGVIVVSIADTLSAAICFILGRTLIRNWIKQQIHKYPNFVQLDRMVGKKGWKILILTRLSPLVPSSVLNYGFSCTRVNFGQYCFCSWIGMLPNIFLYVYLSSFGVSLTQGSLTPTKIVLQVVGLGLAIGAVVYATRLAKRTFASESM